MNLINNRIERDFWLKKMSEKLDVSEEALREDLVHRENAPAPSSRQQPSPEESSSEEQAPTPSRAEKLSQELLALLLIFPGFWDYVFSRAYLDHIFGAENKTFYKNLVLYYNRITSSDKEGNFSYQELKDFFREEINSRDTADNQLQLLNKLVILGEKNYYNLEESRAKNEILKILLELKKEYVSQRMKEIEKTIAEAEKEGEREKVQELMAELKKLSRELSDQE